MRWLRIAGGLVRGLALAGLVTTAATAAAAPADASTASTASTAISVVDDRGRRVDLSAPARRVVSLLPSLTETVCALGACDRLVGTDRYSNWPASVLPLPKLGGLEDTQIERIVALAPDLVLLAGAARATDRLQALGLRVLVLEPKTLADTRRVIETVAEALGEPAAGTALWQRLQQRIAAAAAAVPPSLRGRRVYFEVAAAPYAASESSFIGELLARLGLVNIVPPGLGPFPKLNPEFVVRAQPDLIIATAGALAEMPERPGWRNLQALLGSQRCGFDAAQWDPLVRAGPRVAEAAETLLGCLKGLSPRH